MTFGGVSARTRSDGHQRAITVVAVLLAVFGLLGLFSALELASDLHRLARHGVVIAPGLHVVVYVLITLAALQAISGLVLSYVAVGRSAASSERATRLVRNLTLAATGTLGMLVVPGHACPAPVAAPVAHTSSTHRGSQPLRQF